MDLHILKELTKGVVIRSKKVYRMSCLKKSMRDTRGASTVAKFSNLERLGEKALMKSEGEGR